MTAGRGDLFEIPIQLDRLVPMEPCQLGKANYGVHGRTDIVGEAEQERGFYLAGVLLPLELQLHPEPGLLCLTLLRDVDNEDVIYVPISRHMRKVAVIIDPTHGTVFSDDTVFHIV